MPHDGTRSADAGRVSRARAMASAATSCSIRLISDMPPAGKSRVTKEPIKLRNWVL